MVAIVEQLLTILTRNAPAAKQTNEELTELILCSQNLVENNGFEATKKHSQELYLCQSLQIKYRIDHETRTLLP